MKKEQKLKHLSPYPEDWVATYFKGYDSIFATRLRELMGYEKKRTRRPKDAKEDELKTMKHSNADAEKRMQQDKLAEWLGISRQAVSQYADGTAIPNIDKLSKIADFFGVSADFLLGKTKTKSPIDLYVAVSNYLGLSDIAIGNLREFYLEPPSIENKIIRHFRLHTFNILFENLDVADKLFAYLTDNSESPIAMCTKVEDDNGNITYKPVSATEQSAINLANFISSVTALKKKLSQEVKE